MDVALFEKCLKFISSKYEVELFETLVQSGRLEERKNAATIMFDDGYQDNIEYAAPLLQKYRLNASFYVVTDCIQHNIPTWTYELEYLFQHTRIEDLNLTISTFCPKPSI